MGAELLRIATANTQYAGMLRASDGLDPFRNAGVDVVCMQEVLHVEPGFIEDRLADDGYAVAHADFPTGLVIATRIASRLAVSDRVTHEIAPVPALGRFLQARGLPGATRFRPRGLIAASCPDGGRP